MIAADVLSTGPRGRRMLLAYALEAERAARPEYIYKVKKRDGSLLSSIQKIYNDG